MGRGAAVGSALRQQLRSMLAPGQRELHFRKEKPQRRRTLATAIGRLSVQVRVYNRTCGRTEEESARRDCLTRLTHDLLDVGAHRLVIDTRAERDAHDRHTLQAALGPKPSRTQLVYEHLDSTSESLLWIADAVAWCYSDGGECRRRIAPIVTNVIGLD